MRRYHNEQGNIDGKGLLIAIIAIVSAIGLPRIWPHLPTWGRIVSIMLIGILILVVLAKDWNTGFNSDRHSK